MGALQPNKNFDNERREHTPYQAEPVKPLQERYAELMKSDKKKKPSYRDLRDGSVYAKFFNTK
jgi:hypothetical protein